MPPVPVILIGRMGAMGRVVAEHLKPEVEAIHFVGDLDAAKADLPRFLRHEAPSVASAGDIGGKDYSRPAEAFIFGLGYTNEAIDELRDACQGVGDGIPWLIGGLSKDEFKKLVDTQSLGPPEKHGPESAVKQKTKLLEVLRAGNGGKDGVFHWYS